jgi:hypothetical protein
MPVLTAWYRRSLPDKALTRRLLILLAHSVQTMPITLSINPPFGLLLPDSFGTVSHGMEFAK